MKIIEEGSLLLIVYRDKKYLKKAVINKPFHGKGGAINFQDLFGKPFGIRYGEYEIYEPTMEDLVMFGLKRETQIVFPKDAALISFKLNLRPGSKIIEIGTGSGVLTFVFSNTVGPEGMVVSFEKEERHYKNAKKNIENHCSWENVTLYLGDVLTYDMSGFDAAFIDVREPWEYIDKAHKLLKKSGSIGMIVPTTNQISEALKELQKNFGEIEVLEVLLRKYKTVPERIRPTDRMVAHTGYLIFGRRLD
ncbi:MAG: tRNA (adenine-N1)-methyltransferase [Syntrophorhabdaceae bacterium]|nr:tRNA (adenine-N1)-methyltransferase [Syntrophorhabdaceae bacterium]